MSKNFKIKKPTDLDVMSKEELINYIDSLVSVLKSYQLAIDQAVGNNVNVSY